MRSLISLGVVFLGLLGLSGPAPASESVLLGDIAWASFSGVEHSASLAWAGEDETYTEAVSNAAFDKLLDANPTDVDRLLLTGMPAPEPPALVLAGIAFAGVLCGRSLLRSRVPTGSPEEPTT